MPAMGVVKWGEKWLKKLIRQESDHTCVKKNPSRLNMRQMEVWIDSFNGSCMMLAILEIVGGQGRRDLLPALR